VLLVLVLKGGAIFCIAGRIGDRGPLCCVFAAAAILSCWFQARGVWQGCRCCRCTAAFALPSSTLAAAAAELKLDRIDVNSSNASDGYCTF